MYIICIEINKHRMIIYKNIGRDNIRKKRNKNKYFWGCVLVLYVTERSRNKHDKKNVWEWSHLLGVGMDFQAKEW